MDPKDRVISEGWEEQYVDPNDKTSTAENTYAYVKKYADGRVEIQYYRRGQDGVKRTEVIKDKVTADAFNAELARTTPTATSQATAARDTVTVAGKVMQWNPQTQRYDIEVGPAGTAAATTAKGKSGRVQGTEWVEREIEADGSEGRITLKRPASKEEIDRAAGREGVDTKTEAERKENETKKNTWTTIDTKTEKDADGNSVTVLTQQNLLGETRPVRSTVTALKAGEKYGKPEQGANGQVQPVLNAEGKVIRWEPMPEGGPGVKAPTNIVDLPDGRGKGQLVDSGRRDPSGNPIWETAPIAGTEKKPDTAVPSVDLTQATMGKYTDLLKKQWDEKYVPLIAAGTMTKEAAIEQFEKVDRPLATAKANEEIAVLTAQGNIRSQDVTQRGNTLGEVQNQRSNATSTFNQLASVIKPADAGKYYPEIMARMMEVYGQSTEKLGIPKGVPSDQPYTPQQAQLMGQAAPSPIVFNINTGAAQPQSAPLAGVGAQMGLPGGVPETPGVMPPPTNPEQLLEEMKRNTPDQFWTAAVDRAGQDLQAAREKAAGGVAPGMSLSGGQLRAPGTGPVGAGPVGQVG